MAGSTSTRSHLRRERRHHLEDHAMSTSDEFPPEMVEAVARAICCPDVCDCKPAACSIEAMSAREVRAANAVLHTLTTLGYQRVGPDSVVVHERHANIAMGLLDVPQAERGDCWHIEAEGVLRRLAAAPKPTKPGHD
jgi:hypothetical protein